MKTLRSPVMWIVLSFVLSRIFFYCIGLRFDATPIYWFWQYLDPMLLSHHLLQSIYYLHIQPPLFNLFLGLVLKCCKGFEIQAFQAIFLFLGLVLSIYIFRVLRQWDVSNAIAIPLTLFFIFSPAVLLFENWLNYTYPVVTLLVVSCFYGHRFLTKGNAIDGLLFFLLLACEIYLRSQYQMYWFLLILAFVMAVRKTEWRKVLLVAVLPFTLVFLLYAKNFFVFNQFGTSTWLGSGLYRVISPNISEDLRMKWIRSGSLSEVSSLPPFAMIESYPRNLWSAPPTDIAALDQIVKSSGFANYNYSGYLQLSGYLLRDSLFMIRSCPRCLFNGIAHSFRMFFTSATDSSFLAKNRWNIRIWNRIYDVCGYWNYDGVSFFWLIAIPLVLVVSSFVAGEQPGREFRFVLMFHILYITVVANVFEYGENNRFRFEIDPIVIILLGLLLKGVAQRFNQIRLKQ